MRPIDGPPGPGVEVGAGWDEGTQEFAALVERGVRDRGFVVTSDVLLATECAVLARAVDDAVRAESRWISDRPEEFGRVLSLVHYGGPFLELLGNERLVAPFDRVLGDDCILYTLTTGCLPPGGGPRPVHVDFSYVGGADLLYLAAMVMLDDFTVETGATRFLPGSLGSARPDDRTFDVESVAVEGGAGSVCWFDPRLWHTSGTNSTARWRRSILIGMVRGWMKPRFDHPAMLGSSDRDLSPTVRRVLGFDSRPPASYAEYYGRSAAGGGASTATHPTRPSTA